jgi:hypothetical protein
MVNCIISAERNYLCIYSFRTWVDGSDKKPENKMTKNVAKCFAKEIRNAFIICNEKL